MTPTPIIATPVRASTAFKFEGAALLSASDLHQQLWAKFHQTRDPLLRQQLATMYLDLVHAIALQVARGLPSCVDINDLIQEGFFGLHRAIGMFDPTYKVKFTTYAGGAIRGAMLDSLRRDAWAPRGARQRATEIEAARSELISRLERLPTEEELARGMGLSNKEFEHIATDARVATQISLWGGGGSPDNDRQMTHQDFRESDPTFNAQRTDLRELILKGFDRTERLIVILYYFECMTMKEIGHTLGISESRISQKHTLIVERIKASLATRLKEFL